MGIYETHSLLSCVKWNFLSVLSKFTHIFWRNADGIILGVFNDWNSLFFSKLKHIVKSVGITAAGQFVNQFMEHFRQVGGIVSQESFY